MSNIRVWMQLFEGNAGKLTEAGIIVYGNEGARSPANKLGNLVQRAFEAHATLSQYVDLTLTLKEPRLVEITFLETEQQRQKGHGGAVLQLITAAADALGVTLRLEAKYAAEPPNTRKALKQNDLEAFYARRGFVLLQTGNSERWMERKPAVRESRNPALAVLYHATFNKKVVSIMAHGLGAGDLRRNYEISRPGVVTLSDDPDVAEAYVRNSEFGADDSIAILAIDLKSLKQSLLHRDRNDDGEYGGNNYEYRGIIPPAAISIIAMDQG